MMDSLIHDVRYALRTLLRSPAFTAVAVLTLALGIGANTAIFSVVDGVLLRPLPFPEAERLVMLGHDHPQLDLRGSVSPPGYVEYRAEDRIFESTGAYTMWGANLAEAGDPVRLEGLRVTADLFPTLGVEPLLGRGFVAEEEQPGGGRSVLLSEELWRQRFGADPAILGRALRLDGEPYEVVGVMPALPAPIRAEIWAPLALTPDQLSEAFRGVEFLEVVARLRPGVTVDQARVHMAAVADDIRERVAGVPESWGIWIEPLRDWLVGDVRPLLLVLLGAVGFVLLIACANVANLLLARSTARRREMALRTALGAGRGRLGRQLVTESLTLSLLGGAAGLLTARWGVEAFLALIPDGLPQAHAAAIDFRVAGFTLAVTLLAAVVFGSLPTLQASRARPQEALNEGRAVRGASGRRGARSAIIVAEIALAVVLVLGAGLMIQSVARLQQSDVGLDPDAIVTMRVSLPAAGYPEPERRLAFFRDALAEIESLPGVRSAGATSALPLSGWTPTRSFVVDGYTTPPGEPLPWGEWSIVTPGYFRSLEIPVIRGRAFTLQDLAEGRHVAVVNARLAERYWPGGDALGQRVGFPGSDRRYEVVGVVGDVASQGAHAAPRAQLYLPLGSPVQSHMFLVVKAEGDIGPVPAAVRHAIARVDPHQPVYAVKTMDGYLAGTVAQRRFAMMLLAAFAGLAVLLAGVGVYGVMAYAVSQRTHELGIRMALGAEAGQVKRLVVAQAARLALVGVAIGLVGAWALTRFLADMLYQVSATDPATFVAVALLLSAAATAAGYVPARRATKVDPMIALRAE